MAVTTANQALALGVEPNGHRTNYARIREVLGMPNLIRVQTDSFRWFLEEGLKELFESNSTQARLEQVRKLKAIADEIGSSLAQLAIAWCLRNPHVSSVITGASRPDQVTENMKALNVVGLLDDGIMKRIGDILALVPEV